MMMYLLLRNNKQSGPYSLDDLKTLGLKAYDLVWVDGKSAAWRYPSELEELRSFAPAVEEQPFDRFYKKVSPAKAAASFTGSSRPEAEIENPQPATPHSTVYAAEPSTVPGRRIIYVTMPAGKGTAVVRESAAREATLSREPIRNPAVSPFPDQNRSLDPHPIVPARPVDQTPYQPTPVNAYQPAPAKETVPEPEEKLSQPREEWKSPVEIIPPVRKRSSSRILQPLAVAVCILALLAAGIFIGLSINKDTFGLGKKFASKEASTLNGQDTDRASQQLTVAAPISSAPIQTQAPLTDSVQTRVPAAEKAETVNGTTDARNGKPQPPRQFPPKERSAGSSARSQAALPVVSRDSAAMGIPVVHREAVHRTDLPADKNDNVDKDVVRNNIANLVSVGTKGYTVGTFGGITDLQLTVSNHSVYPLDLVVVEVQYIQANKKVFKTENLYFRGIGPGAALMQEAPKSARGVKIQYKLTLVNSKEPGLSYSGL